jgi:peptide/nickel transport system ATP-binding protein
MAAAISAAGNPALLEIRGLKTHFATDDGVVQAVDGVDLSIMRGETVGVVGESGCGKTVTALSVLKLIAMPPGRIVAGQILWQGRDLVPLDSAAMSGIRSKEIAIVFQEPMTSLNPVYTAGYQIAEVIRLHEGLTRSRHGRRSEAEEVQIPNPGTGTTGINFQAACASGDDAMLAAIQAADRGTDHARDHQAQILDFFPESSSAWP